MPEHAWERPDRFASAENVFDYIQNLFLPRAFQDLAFRGWSMADHGETTGGKWWSLSPTACAEINRSVRPATCYRQVTAGFKLTAARGLSDFGLVVADATNNRLPAAVFSLAVSFDGRRQNPVFCSHNGTSWAGLEGTLISLLINFTFSIFFVSLQVFLILFLYCNLYRKIFKTQIDRLVGECSTKPR